MAFSVANQQLADQLKAVAHPARLHLKILKEAGLVVGTIDGPRSCYCLDGQAFFAFCQTFIERLAGLEARETPQDG